METDLDVNPAHDAWRLSTGPEKERTLEILVRRLEKFVMAICYQRLSDHRNDLDALVNGIVWRIIRRMHTFKRGSKFSSWTYRIIVNECNRYLRNFKERCETNLEEEMLTKAEILDARIDLIAMLNGLEGQDHFLFRMIAEGQEFRTIGEALGISRNAAIVRWSRLKEKLRDAS